MGPGSRTPSKLPRHLHFWWGLAQVHKNCSHQWACDSCMTDMVEVR